MAYDYDEQDRSEQEHQASPYVSPNISSHSQDAVSKATQKDAPVSANSSGKEISGTESPTKTGQKAAAQPANTAGTGSNFAASAAGKSAAGGAAGTGGAAGAGTAAAGASAASSGTAAGAAAGSVVPGLGTAIGAGIGAAAGGAKAADNAKKAKEMNDAAAAHVSSKSGGYGEEKKNGISDTSVPVKVIVGIVAVIAALFMAVLLLATQMIESIAAPIMAVFKLFQSGADYVRGLEERLDNNASFEDVQAVFIADLQSAIEKAYTDVCKDEVYQIAIEQEYDIDLTMESYTQTKFPYDLNGEDCNINYAEIFNVISLSEDWSVADKWKSFDYSEFQVLYEDREFLRTLYTLNVEKTEKYIVNETMLGAGESCEIHSDKSVTITHADGSTTNYTGTSAEAYFDTVIYGEVTVNPYGLLELFDYFSIDPYSVSEILPNMTNWKAMEYQEYFTRCYKPDMFWGTDERTRLIPYKRQTGEITRDAGDMYMKDIFDFSVITEDYVYYEVPLFKQADSRWGSRKYLNGTMKSQGCCVTSMAMVVNYFGNSSVDPGTLLDKMNKNYSGNLYRPALSEEYGFWHYLDDNSFAMHSDLTKITGALINQQLVIAHIKPNSSEHFATKNGHWIVLHGFQRAGAGEDTDKAITDDGSSGFFFVNDPNRNNETMTFLEAANLIDRIQSYGYR